ncbi:MAG: hypothetical protein QOF90_2667 [Acetobacteraceae bacterium]|nr:hypothetical protein [Acetobacteraceae bacterium]MEA2777261.1 hypothetical protein [Acetobacteraceae bacterium]
MCGTALQCRITTADPANGSRPDTPAALTAYRAGDTIATIEAMKMEAAITATRVGTVARPAATRVAQVDGDDLLAFVTA